MEGGHVCAALPLTSFLGFKTLPLGTPGHANRTCVTETHNEQARRVQMAGGTVCPSLLALPWMESSADMEAFPDPFTTRHVYTPTSSWLTSWISRTCIPFFSDIDTRALGCRGASPCGWERVAWSEQPARLLALSSDLQPILVGQALGTGSRALCSGLCQHA